MKRLLAFLILTVAAFAQSTTTVTGTVKDLTNSVVTAGQVTFDLKPGLDTTISGAARFSPSTVVCTINGSGLIKALDGISACVVTENTSLTPAGTYYKVCLQPNSITPGSCFNWYALSASFDITTAVPTPGTMPAFTFVDLNSNQTITGIKTHTGVPVFSAGISGTAGQTLSLPSSADTLIGRATTDTMSNKTFVAPVLGVAAATSLSIGGGLALNSQTGTGQAIVTNVGPNITIPVINQGISSVGTGYKHVRSATTCTTGAAIGAACTTAAINWSGSAFADTNYDLVCTLSGSVTNVPTIVTTAKSTGSFTVTIAALTAAAASYSEVDCSGTHD